MDCIGPWTRRLLACVWAMWVDNDGEVLCRQRGERHQQAHHIRLLHAHLVAACLPFPCWYRCLFVSVSGTPFPFKVCGVARCHPWGHWQFELSASAVHLHRSPGCACVCSECLAARLLSSPAEMLWGIEQQEAAMPGEHAGGILHVTVPRKPLPCREKPLPCTCSPAG